MVVVVVVVVGEGVDRLSKLLDDEGGRKESVSSDLG